MISILIVEDDLSLAKNMSNMLGNYKIAKCTTVHQALKQLVTNYFDLAVIDLNLADKSGLTICEFIQKNNLTTEVLVVTGDNSLSTKLACFDLGIEDYLCKPFEILELKARIKKTINKILKIKAETVETKDLLINLEAKTAQYKQAPLILRKKEFEILAYLALNAGRPVSRNFLTQTICKNYNKIHSSNAIDVHIKRIRDKTTQNFISTVHGVGYKLNV